MNTKPNNDRERAIWHEAVEFGTESIVTEMLRQHSDKLFVIEALRGKAYSMATTAAAEGKLEQSLRLFAYSEAMRHVINILKNNGNGFDAFNGILNPGSFAETSSFFISWSSM